MYCILSIQQGERISKDMLIHLFQPQVSIRIAQATFPPTLVHGEESRGPT